VTDDRRPKLLVESWPRCDEMIHALGMRESDKLMTRLGPSASSNIFEFLVDIEFMEGARLSRIGFEYFQSKFVMNDQARADKIITEAVKLYRPTQAICQLLWGRPGLKRTNVYNLLVSEEYLDGNAVSETQIGSFLMLMNQCKILTYSKRTQDITVIFKPRTESPDSLSTRFLSPETPYSNLRNLWDVLRSCHGFIHWFDKHFGARGLEALHDEADGNKINEIRILAGVSSRGVNEKLRRDFQRFREELSNRLINSQIRVICDKEILSDIHDRWIVSDKICYNVPPVDTMFMGQYSELKQTTYRPPFAQWWEKGYDLIEQWPLISEQIQASQLTSK
jgi:hypothetical protein